MSGRCINLCLKIKGSFEAKDSAFRENKVIDKEAIVCLVPLYASRLIEEEAEMQKYPTAHYKKNNYDLVLVQDSNVRR